MHRAFIIIPVYAAVVIFLPRQDWFLPIIDLVSQVDPFVAFWTSMASSAAAGLLLWVITKRPFQWMIEKPRIAAVIGMGCFGILIAGVFDLFEFLAGSSVNLVNLILLPIGYMISEAVFLAIRWRMQERQEDEL